MSGSKFAWSTDKSRRVWCNGDVLFLKAPHGPAHVPGGSNQDVFVFFKLFLENRSREKGVFVRVARPVFQQNVLRRNPGDEQKLPRQLPFFGHVAFDNTARAATNQNFLNLPGFIQQQGLPHPVSLIAQVDVIPRFAIDLHHSARQDNPDAWTFTGWKNAWRKLPEQS